MALPLLRFVAHYDCCDIIVENLPSLTVPQIQQLEKFASDRRGQLDFSNSKIRIHKRIDFEYFNRILELSGIQADTIESEVVKATPVKAVNALIGFGKHRGTSYSELPVEYLLWLKQNYQGHERQYIEQECINRSI
ncbi:MAG: hypothetical protein U9Q62_10160 [Campylobacterota bacterium]|nr:hypothetical protein [Campylobacterota bacterium]